MYYTKDENQLTIDDFYMPFAGKLDPNNRWGRLSRLMPWKRIEEIYLRSMSQETGHSAIPERIAFGAIYIKESENYTDERCVTAIRENPYMQYFLGLHEFRQEPLFDPSMMVHFRKRFPVEDVARINEYVCTGKWPEDGRCVDRNDEKKDSDDDDSEPPKSGKCVKGRMNPNTSKKKAKRQKKNRGKILLDTTVAPADIKYPTDIDLLNRCREHRETAINILWKHVPHKGHKLPYSAKKARKSYLSIAKFKRWTKKKVRKGIGEQMSYIEQAGKQLEKFRALAPDVKLPNWLAARLEVIPEVYAQQKYMYDGQTSTRTAICRPRRRTTAGSSASTRRRSWRTRSTRPEPTGPGVRNGTSVFPARFSDGAGPENPGIPGRCVGTPANATPSREETEISSGDTVLA